MRSFELLLSPWRRHMLAHSRPVGLPATVPANVPLVLVANHTSWWDGLLLRDIHRALRPRAPFYIVMTETELRRFPFFRLMGAVPLEPGSVASVLRMVRSLRALVRQRPDATIAFFPQGRIWPAWRRPLGFKRGIEMILDAIGPCAVLPVGIHMEPLNRSAPSAFVLAGQPLTLAAGSTMTAAALEVLVEDRLTTIQSVLTLHGEDTRPYMAALT
jgi:1-acyl-sn-glycerol-3-phosphate acyltransferase